MGGVRATVFLYRMRVSGSNEEDGKTIDLLVIAIPGIMCHGYEGFY